MSTMDPNLLKGINQVYEEYTEKFLPKVIKTFKEYGLTEEDVETYFSIYDTPISKKPNYAKALLTGINKQQYIRKMGNFGKDEVALYVVSRNQGARESGDTLAKTVFESWLETCEENFKNSLKPVNFGSYFITACFNAASTFLRYTKYHDERLISVEAPDERRQESSTLFEEPDNDIKNTPFSVKDLLMDFYIIAEDSIEIKATIEFLLQGINRSSFLKEIKKEINPLLGKSNLRIVMQKIEKGLSGFWNEIVKPMYPNTFSMDESHVKNYNFFNVLRDKRGEENE